MKIARVDKTVVATIHHPSLDGKRLLLCRYLDASGRSSSRYTIAVDTVGAGVGETVLIVDEGNGARQILGDPNAPIRAVVAGIVAAVDVDGGETSPAPSSPAT